MRYAGFALTAILAAGGSTLLPNFKPLTRTVTVVDTVFVKAPIDYNEIANRVAKINAAPQGPMIVDGDLIVKGRVGIGGAPEPNTGYSVTVHGQGDSRILFISNESLTDPQRAGNQHRHVGAMGLSHDGGLRMDQNAVCYTDARGCEVDDRLRRRAISGYDSMGDMSFFLSDVDSLTGKMTAPPMQNLVLRLIDWDGNIKFAAHRPGQRIFFQGSTTPRAADIQWEVPLH